MKKASDEKLVFLAFYCRGCGDVKIISIKTRGKIENKKVRTSRSRNEKKLLS